MQPTKSNTGYNIGCDIVRDEFGAEQSRSYFARYSFGGFAGQVDIPAKSVKVTEYELNGKTLEKYAFASDDALKTVMDHIAGQLSADAYKWWLADSHNVSFEDMAFYDDLAAAKAAFGVAADEDLSDKLDKPVRSAPSGLVMIDKKAKKSEK